MSEYGFTLHFMDSSEILVVCSDENKRDDFIRWMCSNEGSDRKWFYGYMVNRNNVCYMQYKEVDEVDVDDLLKRLSY